MKNLTPVKSQNSPTALTHKEIESLREKNNKLVRGRFKDYEVPGGTLEFSFGPLYKGDKQYTYSHINGNALKDGEVYDLPRCVAIHLNKNCWYPTFEHKPSESYIVGANPYSNTPQISKKTHRFGFQSLEFDGEDIGPAAPVFMVENAL